MGGGTVGSAHYEEVVVCTFSGRVIGLTREPLTQQTLSQEVGIHGDVCIHGNRPHPQVQEKLESLRQEVESLEEKVGVAKEQYQKTVAAAQVLLNSTFNKNTHTHTHTHTHPRVGQRSCRPCQLSR